MTPRNSLCKPGDRKQSDLLEHPTNATKREKMSRWESRLSQCYLLPVWCFACIARCGVGHIISFQERGSANGQNRSDVTPTPDTPDLLAIPHHRNPREAVMRLRKMVDVLILAGLAVQGNKVVQFNNDLRSNSIQGSLYIDIWWSVALT